MARYFFHLHNDSFTQDEEGRECAGLEDARTAAIQEARVMASSYVLQGHLDLSHFIEVADSTGQRVLVVPFGEAVAVRS
jgi:hypothetical protein